MKQKGRFADENGAVIYWVLIILLVAVIAGVVAVKQLPAPPSPSQSTVVKKVPPIPPAVSPSPEPIMQDMAATEHAPLVTLPKLKQTESGTDENIPDTSPQTTESEPAPETPAATAEPSSPSYSTKPMPIPASEEAPEPTASPEDEGMQAKPADEEKPPQDKVTAPQDQPIQKNEPETTAETIAKDNPLSYCVQVGAFHNRKYAERTVAAMEKIGYTSFISPIIDTNNQTFHLVCIGKYQSKSEAAAVALAFSKKENMEAVVTLLRIEPLE